jgi:glutamyl-Q tRNA(Asp) synthetase
MSEPAPLLAYVGRFAPSPTGPLHFGSLVAATASYLDAKASGGDWLVRIEDLDRERTQPGAADKILRDLDAFGFQWTGPVMYQSTRDEAYRAAFDQLQQTGLVYPCACSRKEIADAAGLVSRPNSAYNLADTSGPRYPGTCRNGVDLARVPTSFRLRVSDQPIHFNDRVQGPCSLTLDQAAGDFVIKRPGSKSNPADAFAYQLAVVVDDAQQNITHVVRGADLLDSTPRQIYIQQLLNLSHPSYAHVPAAIDAQGNKLSKQTRATALDSRNASTQLQQALEFLGQHPPPELQRASLDNLWQWAISNWSMATIPATPTRPQPTVC